MSLLYDQIAKIAHWPTILALVIAVALCAKAFDVRNRRLGQEIKIFDGRCWYTPAEAKTFLNDIGEDGRGFYAATQLTLDMIFPVVYGSLFATLIVCFYGRPLGSSLLVLPMIVVGFDFLENFSTTYLALSFNGCESRVTWFSAVCTASKWTCIAVIGVVTAVGFLWLLIQRIRKTSVPDARSS